MEYELRKGVNLNEVAYNLYNPEATETLKTFLVERSVELQHLRDRGSYDTNTQEALLDAEVTAIGNILMDRATANPLAAGEGLSEAA